MASYTYDAWGNILSSSGTLAEINPLRYRGYYYDSETGFYYLQSRYYDPENHRFINADGQINVNSFTGHNMFSYCNNNPVAFADHDGREQKYTLSETTRKFFTGDALIIVTKTVYLTVPDDVPLTVALSEGEVSFSEDFLGFNAAAAIGVPDGEIEWDVSLTLYDGEVVSLSLNLEKGFSTSTEIQLNEYVSCEYSVTVIPNPKRRARNLKSNTSKALISLAAFAGGVAYGTMKVRLGKHKPALA